MYNNLKFTTMPDSSGTRRTNPAVQNWLRHAVGRGY